MIGLCGNVAIGKDASNGQTIKTRIVLNEIRRCFPNEEIDIVDTVHVRLSPVKEMLHLIKLINKSDRIVILPAFSAINILSLLISFFRKHKNTYYVVIGGWLPDMLRKRRVLKNQVKRYAGVYVETHNMHETLAKMGLNNVFYLSNCKPLVESMPSHSCIKYHFCTFSRISKEKGIEMAINAIREIKEKNNELDIKLDIYGKPDDEYMNQFDIIRNELPDYIEYCGVVDSKKASSVLKNYYALLFPTYYYGEGFPGTILDAFASSLPVIASNWKYNAEIVREYETGLIFENQSEESLTNAILFSITHTNEFMNMRKNCFSEAKKYTPENVMKQFIQHLKDGRRK